MKVSITTQSSDRDDAQVMRIDTLSHSLYRGCHTLEDVRRRCVNVLNVSLLSQWSTLHNITTFNFPKRKNLVKSDLTIS
jgi:hypothetical protein